MGMGMESGGVGRDEPEVAGVTNEMASCWTWALSLLSCSPTETLLLLSCDVCQPTSKGLDLFLLLVDERFLSSPSVDR